MSDDEVLVLGPGEGRAYEVGAMTGVFKAAGEECGDRYCVSEWSVEPGANGPGPHHHDGNEELFLVTEGTMAFRLGDDWIDAAAGTFIRIPAGVTHDFANRTDRPARAFNVFLPGSDFEGSLRGWLGLPTAY